MNMQYAVSIKIIVLSICNSLVGFNQQEDMWDWMAHDGWSTTHMDGTHKLQSRVRGNELSHIKFGVGTQSFEIYNLIDGNIYLSYEGLGNNDYRYYAWKGFKWVPRYVSHGTEYWVGNFDECWVDDCSRDCRYRIQSWPCKVFFKPNFIWVDGSNRDVIEITMYWDKNAINDTEGEREKYFYAKNYGLVRWEYWKDLTMLQSSDFNQVTSGTFGEIAPCWPTVECNPTNFPSVCNR